MTTIIDQLAEALDNVAASLDNTLLHLGDKMTPEDRRTRTANVAEAQRLVAQYRKLKPNPANMVRKVCGTCGSEDVHCDGTTEWDVEQQAWIVVDTGTGDGDYCHDCGSPCTIEEQPVADPTVYLGARD